MELVLRLNSPSATLPPKPWVMLPPSSALGFAFVLTLWSRLIPRSPKSSHLSLPSAKIPGMRAGALALRITSKKEGVRLSQLSPGIKGLMCSPSGFNNSNCTSPSASSVPESRLLATMLPIWTTHISPSPLFLANQILLLKGLAELTRLQKDAPPRGGAPQVNFSFSFPSSS